MEVKESNYHSIKGILDRNHGGDSSRFNDTELRSFFQAHDDTITKLRKEEKPKVKTNVIRISKFSPTPYAEKLMKETFGNVETLMKKSGYRVFKSLK